MNYEEFDDKYADELDALDDFHEPESLSPKPKRSLNFTTPKNKLQATPLTQSNGHDDNLTPLKSTAETLNGSVFDRSQSGTGLYQKKRPRTSPSGNQSDSDLEYDDEDLSCTVPSSKRSKVVDDDFDDDDPWNDDIEQLKRPVSILGAQKRKSKSPAKDVPDLPGSPDRHLMERILQHRNKHNVRELQLDPQVDRQQSLVNDYDFERQRVFTRIPACPYLPTTSSSGDRVYMKLKDEQDLDKEIEIKLKVNEEAYESMFHHECLGSRQTGKFESYGKTIKGTQLLTVPIPALRDQIEEERRMQLLEESERLSEQVHRELNQDDQGFIDYDDEQDEDKENLAPPAGESLEPQKLLWVEKYSPRGYTDLLSEESINRALLHWLKLWDYLVFGKELVVKNKEKKEEKKKFESKFKKKNEPALLDELDKHKRPLQKLALLTGPPGLGKTTLAHIIARHAGYSVIEMNASDDRSAEIFKTKIESATQMKAVLGADPRPNCLVIDEIDGAPQAAINVLLNIVRRSEMPEKEGRKKKDEGGILLRPIICICNDQYVPALRVLRQNSMILNFPQTDPSKLASRLYEVVRIERLKSDMNTLLALCEKTNNDIRSCLNTLQFIQRQCKEFNLKAIQTMTVGQKDSHKSLFSVWYEILTLPKPKRQRYTNLEDASVKNQSLNTSPLARFNNVHSLVQGTGEYEKLTQGLFENFLDCKFKDPHMDGVALATEWLVFNDLVTQYIQHKQDYRVLPYLPFLSVTFHFLFASNVAPKIQYPHSQAENNMKRMKHENLVTSMMTDMSPGTRKFLNIQVAVMEVLPPLMDIIQPNFRPVNTQLYSSREKADLANLVHVMIAYNMTYHQEKSFEGQYVYVLDPHMEEVVRYPGMKPHKQLTYASKQLIAREVELEKMRRSENSRKLPEQPSTSKTSSSNKTDKLAIPNHLQKLTAKPIGKEEEMQVKDFFGRVIKKTTPEAKKTTTSTGGSTDKTNLLATDIWFHFQEGYSNAVRRNVRVKDFF